MILGIQGPGFDIDMHRPNARIFMWISRLLTDRSTSTSNAANPIVSLGPPKPAVARSALYNLLSTNPELADVFIDQCYDSSPSGVVSRVYFQVRHQVPLHCDKKLLDRS